MTAGDEAAPRAFSEEDQQRRRAWFGRHWEKGVPFNVLCGVRVERWDPERVVLALPFDERLTAHEGVFHGGVLSALADTAATGAVMAGHDFNLGTLPVTLTLTIQYLATAPGEDIVAEAACAKRGRTNFVDVVVRSRTGVDLAHAMATVAVTGRPPVPRAAP